MNLAVSAVLGRRDSVARRWRVMMARRQEGQDLVTVRIASRASWGRAA